MTCATTMVADGLDRHHWLQPGLAEQSVFTRLRMGLIRDSIRDGMPAHEVAAAAHLLSRIERLSALDRRCFVRENVAAHLDL